MAWVCANGGVVAGRALVASLEQSALQWINRSKEKCRSWATLVRYLCSNAVSTSLPLTAQEQEHTYR